MPLKTKVSKSVVIALLSNLFVSCLKFIGYIFSQSPSMLAESVHSFADTANQFFLLLGEKTSSLESTKEHPFGKGSYQYLFNFMSAMGIFFIGCSITIYHSIHSLLNPTIPLSGTFFYLSISILIVSFIVEGYSLYAVIKEINLNKKDFSFLEYVFKGSNPTLSAIFLEDSIAVFGVLLALLGQSLAQIYQSTMPDAIFGLVIGILLGFIALFLSYVNAQLLIGKSAGIDKEEEIKDFLESLPIIEKVCDLKTEVLKPNAIAVIVEVEINGSAMFSDKRVEDQLGRDSNEIFDLMLDDVDNIKGLKRILVKIQSRANRTYGKKIDEIQALVKKEFPEVVMINLEIK
jgi:solute carrier family 30 (zinc transporter), member 9